MYLEVDPHAQQHYYYAVTVTLLYYYAEWSTDSAKRGQRWIHRALPMSLSVSYRALSQSQFKNTRIRHVRTRVCSLVRASLARVPQGEDLSQGHVVCPTQVCTTVLRRCCRARWPAPPPPRQLAPTPPWPPVAHASRRPSACHRHVNCAHARSDSIICDRTTPIYITLRVKGLLLRSG